jgi:hypothetical protein
MNQRAVFLVLAALAACNQARTGTSGRTRSEAVASASQEMSGPSLFSDDVLQPALQTLRARAGDRWLRLEVKAHEIVLQAEDGSNPGAVLEYHYRDGQLAEPEHAVLRGKGQLADNLFELTDVKLDAIPALAQEAVRRIDPESGSVERVLVRRNLPQSADVRVRVYVASPRWSGHLEADHNGQPL